MVQILMRKMYLFEGAELSIDLRRSFLGEAFHLCFQVFSSLALWAWQRAEMLKGKHFQKNADRNLVLLESPMATFLASSSAHFLGLKSR
jgi:hypothetical protein